MSTTSDAPGGGGGPSLAGRFAAAIALTLGFYLLALAVAAGLLAVAILPWVLAHHGNLWLTVTGVFLGGSILTAIVPRRHRFTAPGLRVSDEDQPRLLALVREEAEAAGEPMPDEVYLTLDANAAVTQAGRRRVLIVGLPLLHILSERQLRAVIAHEFGHYTGGDTRLGPLFHRTQTAIGRTLERLQDSGGEARYSRVIVRKPFEWYAAAFLRITAAISRREEFAADALAARRAGRDVQVATLRRLHAFAPAFDGYWRSEVAPLLSAGRRPPVSEGFRRFIAAGWVEEAAASQLEHELAERTDPYASHPSLAERIAAAEHLPAGEPDGSARATELLEDEPGTEQRALEAVFGSEVSLMEPIGWDRTGELCLERARDTTGRLPELLRGVTAGGLADAVGELPATANRLVEDGCPPEEAPEVVAAVLADGLIVALDRAGWRIEGPVAEPILAVRGEARLAPWAIVAQLRSGELDASAWHERATALGIADLPLGAPAAEPEPATQVQPAMS